MQLLIVPVEKVPGQTAKAAKVPARPTTNLFSCAPYRYLPGHFPNPDDPLYGQAVQAYIYSQAQALISAQGPDQLPVPDAVTDPFLRVQMKEFKGRSLFHPGMLNDADLHQYVMTLAPFALAPSASSALVPQSPLIAEYLLAGIPRTKLEELTERVMAVCEFPEMMVDPTFSDAMAIVGFGTHADYTHVDHIRASDVEPLPGEAHENHVKRLNLQEPEPAYANKGRLSARQAYLSQELPGSAPFVETLVRKGAYDESLMRRVSRMKWEVCKETLHLFSEFSDEMQPRSRKRLREGNVAAYQRATFITDVKFANAVDRVFKQPWSDLELSGQLKDLSDDVERVMARLLIKKLTGGSKRALVKPVKMSARCLLGIALLTAIPVMNLVRFALEDFCRRGETFIDLHTLDDLQILITESEMGIIHFTAGEELQRYRMLMQEWEKNEELQPVSHFAYKLRLGAHMLWNMQGSYHFRAKELLPPKPGEPEDVWIDIFHPKLDRKLAGLPRNWPFEVRV